MLKVLTVSIFVFSNTLNKDQTLSLLRTIMGHDFSFFREFDRSDLGDIEFEPPFGGCEVFLRAEMPPSFDFVEQEREFWLGRVLEFVATSQDGGGAVFVNHLFAEERVPYTVN